VNHIDDEGTREIGALRGVMERGMAGVHPDLPQLELLAARQGRRLRTRRRTGVAAGAAALSVAAVFGIAQLGPGAAGARDVEVAQSPTPSGPATPVDDWWRMPADQMREHLEPLLPAGVEVVSATPDVGTLAATLAGPDGDGDLMVILSEPAPDEAPDGYEVIEKDGQRYIRINGSGQDLEQQLSCPGDLGPADQCTEVVDADGERVGRTAVVSMGRVVVHQAVVVGPGGGTVYVAAANATDQRWSADSPIDGPEPPLTVAQVLALAEDPAWTS
jgi:hypothetical protein